MIVEPSLRACTKAFPSYDDPVQGCVSCYAWFLEEHGEGDPVCVACRCTRFEHIQRGGKVNLPDDLLEEIQDAYTYVLLDFGQFTWIERRGR